MFGMIHACRGSLGDELFGRWQAHLCGLCLSLRSSRGQLSRTLTNTDAVMLSVLVEAQQHRPEGRVRAGACPLRGLRAAEVVSSGSGAARLGATASVTLAAGKAGDVRTEARLGLARPGLKARSVGLLAGPLRRSASVDTAMAEVAHVSSVLDDLSRQGGIEAAVVVGDQLLPITGPTARSAGQIFASSAVVAGRPENEQPLREVGEAFGSLAHLIDAMTDLDADRRAGSFNPITATGTRTAMVRAICRDLVWQIRDGFDRLALTDDELARVLLVDGTHEAFHRTFDVQSSVSDPDRSARPAFWPNLLPWIGVYCSGYACCASHRNPCTGRRHPPGRRRCDPCDGCDCCCDC